MIRFYIRTSTKKQDQKSQVHALEAEAVKYDQVEWYRDTATGKNQDRPGWQKLLADLRPGDTVVVWAVDRAGRSAKDLANTFADFIERGITLKSLKESVDLSTPAGKLIAHVLASVAQFETELRVERILAGQEAARALGKKIGGRKVGTRIRLTEEKEKAIKQLHKQGMPITEIARSLDLSRTTVYGAIA